MSERRCLRLWKGDKPWKWVIITGQKMGKAFFWYRKGYHWWFSLTPFFFWRDNCYIRIGLSFLWWTIFLEIHGYNRGPTRRCNKCGKRYRLWRKDKDDMHSDIACSECETRAIDALIAYCLKGQDVTAPPQRKEG